MIICIAYCVLNTLLYSSQYRYIIYCVKFTLWIIVCALIHHWWKPVYNTICGFISYCRNAHSYQSTKDAINCKFNIAYSYIYDIRYDISIVWLISIGYIHVFNAINGKANGNSHLKVKKKFTFFWLTLCYQSTWSSSDNRTIAYVSTSQWCKTVVKFYSTTVFFVCL